MTEKERERHNKFVIDHYGAKFEDKGEMKCNRCARTFPYRVIHFIGHKEGGCKIECPYCGCLHTINPVATDYIFKEDVANMED